MFPLKLERLLACSLNTTLILPPSLPFGCNVPSPITSPVSESIIGNVCANLSELISIDSGTRISKKSPVCTVSVAFQVMFKKKLDPSYKLFWCTAFPLSLSDTCTNCTSNLRGDGVVASASSAYAGNAIQISVNTTVINANNLFFMFSPLLSFLSFTSLQILHAYDSYHRILLISLRLKASYCLMNIYYFGILTMRRFGFLSPLQFRKS